MDTFEITCVECGNHGSVSERSKGREVRCRKCGKRFIAEPGSSTPVRSVSESLADRAEPEPETYSEPEPRVWADGVFDPERHSCTCGSEYCPQCGHYHYD